MGIDLSEYGKLTPDKQEELLAAERARKQKDVDIGKGEGFGIKKGEDLAKRAKSDEKDNPSKPTQ